MLHGNSHLALALLPLAMYLLWQGFLVLRLRPRWISGTSNTLGIAWAIMGLAVVGPLPLILPDHAVQRFGVLIWWMVLALYILVTILIVLLARPHVFVANITKETLKPLVSEIVRRLDPQSIWAGDSVWLPQAGLEFRLESQPFFKVVQLATLGKQTNIAVWDQLLRELRVSLRTVRTGVSPWGWSQILAGTAILVLLGYLNRELFEQLRAAGSALAMVTKLFRELLAL